MRHPTSSDVTNAPRGSNMFEVRPSKLSNSVFPKKPIGRGPIEIALNTPIILHTMVTTHAAFVREIWRSSEIIEVPISCIEIVDVSAARLNSAKNIMEMTYATL